MAPGQEIGAQDFSRVKPVEGITRLARVQDAKSRMIGVDKLYLEAQVVEKNGRAANEKARDVYYDQMADYYDRKLLALEQERLGVEARLARDIADYRAAEQTAPTRREYDLSDPMALKSSLPARVGDDDSRLGISSMQVFSGEDLAAGERKKTQVAQQAAWCKLQADEKAATVAAEKTALDGFVALLRAQEDFAKEAANAAAAARKGLTYDIVAFNKAEAAYKAEKAKSASEMKQSADDFEIECTKTSALMSEDPNLALSCLWPPGRVRPDHYKGMSAAQKGDVLAFQAMQREELATNRQEEKDAAAAYATQVEGLRRTAELQAQQVESFKAEQRAAVAATLKLQQTEKVQLKKLENMQPSDSDAFFSQFGTSHR